MIKPIIEVNNLTASYGPDTIVLENISFSVNKGEVFVILGESGCGKSTLLRHLLALEKPTKGIVKINDARIDSDQNLFNQLYSRIGVLFQGGALFGSMSLAENVALPLKTYTRLNKAIIDDIVRMKLRMVNLEGYENHLPSELSGGMQKRAGIARALAMSPPMLFLDEPSAGLDPVTAAELDDLIVSFNKNLGMTIVVVTHDLGSILKVGQRCIMLDKKTKSIIAEGNPKVLKKTSTTPIVHNFFNRQVL